MQLSGGRKRYMALTKQDKEYFALTVKQAISEAIQPLATQVNEHEQTLYGVNRDNGLRSQVKWLNRFAWLLTGGLILAGSILGTFQFILKG